MHVFCDFDGTITTVDTTDFILSRLARPEWEAVERRWLAGEITAAACMRAQIALIDADQAALNSALDEVTLCEGFTEFVNWLAARAIPLTIISDGIDYFIQRILARHGLGQSVEVYANHLTGGAGAWKLEQPWALSGCTAGTGVCKCGVAQISGFNERGRRLVFIGDGRSDHCISTKSDFLIAKGWLAEQATKAGQPHVSFDTFHNVIAALTPLLASPAHTDIAVA